MDRRREALDAAFADLDATFTRHMREDGMTDTEIERVRMAAPF